IYEKKGSFKGLKLAFVGDGNNMSQSLLMGCAMMGIDCHVAVPKGYEVKPAFLEKAREMAKSTGVVIEQRYDPESAVKDTDMVDTDGWKSMGKETESLVRPRGVKDCQVNQSHVQQAKDDYLFMDCVPAKQGEEVTDEVRDGENAVVFEQAENRLHGQKAG